MIVPAVNLSAILPEIILSGFAVLVLMSQFWKTLSDRNFYALLSLTGVLLSGFIVFSNFGNPAVSAFSGSWVDDNYARMFKAIFLLGTGMTILLSVRYTRDEEMAQGEYYFLLLFATVGMMAMAGGADMMTIFLGLELLSICLYVLAGMTRNRAVSVEASMKYFILGSFATGFLLYGMVLIYGATGTTSLIGIGNSIERENLNTTYLLTGMVLLLVGFGFKMAVVPFHMWTPDVYEGASAPVTAFMSVGPKAAAFAAFVRVFLEALPSLQTNWTNLLWIVSVLTMTVGNVIALKQESVKRMLAYSSIAHVGYILIGLVAIDKQGIAAMIFYLLAYAFMNIGAFGVVVLIARKGENMTRYEDYAGLFQTCPWLAVIMTIFLLSLAGIPPTAGFMGKFFVFSAAVKANYIGLAVIGVLNSVVSVYYYLRVTIMMYMKEPAKEAALPIGYSPALVVLLLIALYGVIRLGIAPSGYLAMARSAILPF